MNNLFVRNLVRTCQVIVFITSVAPSGKLLIANNVQEEVESDSVAVFRQLAKYSWSAGR